MTTDTAIALDPAARGGERSDDADLHAWHVLAPLATEYVPWTSAHDVRFERRPRDGGIAIGALGP